MEKVTPTDFFKQNSVFIDIYIYFVTIVKAVESVNLNVN